MQICTEIKNVEALNCMLAVGDRSANWHKDCGNHTNCCPYRFLKPNNPTHSHAIFIHKFQIGYRKENDSFSFSLLDFKVEINAT